MKTFFAAFVLCLSTSWISAIAQNPTSARGCVAFKDGYPPSPSLEEYRSTENLGTNIAVTTVAGSQFRIFSNQNAIFIPYPTDPKANLEKATAAIQQARKTYPEFSRRLAVVEKAWATAPRKNVVAIPAAPVAQQPSVIAKALADKKPPGIEIVTISGNKYENVAVTLVEPDGISISHDGGLVKIPFTDLNEELRAKYGFDAQKAAQFSAATQEALKQRVAAQQKALATQQVQAEQLKRTKSFDVQVATVVGKNGAVVSPLTSTEEIPSPIFVEGLIGVAEGEKYEISAFRDGIYSSNEWTGLQRWKVKNVSKELRILQQEKNRIYRGSPGKASSLQRIGGG